MFIFPRHGAQSLRFAKAIDNRVVLFFSPLCNDALYIFLSLLRGNTMFAGVNCREELRALHAANWLKRKVFRPAPECAALRVCFQGDWEIAL